MALDGCGSWLNLDGRKNNNNQFSLAFFSPAGQNVTRFFFWRGRVIPVVLQQDKSLNFLNIRTKHSFPVFSICKNKRGSNDLLKSNLKKTVDRRYVKVKTEHGRHGRVLTKRPQQLRVLIDVSQQMKTLLWINVNVVVIYEAISAIFLVRSFRNIKLTCCIVNIKYVQEYIKKKNDDYYYYFFLLVTFLMAGNFLFPTP
jgi:hypothetical protein